MKAKYRKKPVVIEAVQWLPDKSPHSFPEWWQHHMLMHPDRFNEESGAFTIRTLEGDMIANVGDWIIKGVKGEFYPCKPDIFKATYEPVEDTQ